MTTPRIITRPVCMTSEAIFGKAQEGKKMSLPPSLADSSAAAREQTNQSEENQTLKPVDSAGSKLEAHVPSIAGRLASGRRRPSTLDRERAAAGKPYIRH
jgi:hypothetical protein